MHQAERGRPADAGGPEHDGPLDVDVGFVVREAVANFAGQKDRTARHRRWLSRGRRWEREAKGSVLATEASENNTEHTQHTRHATRTQHRERESDRAGTQNGDMTLKAEAVAHMSLPRQLEREAKAVS